MSNSEEKDENHNVIKLIHWPFAIYSDYLHAIFDVFLCFPSSSSLELQINKIDACRVEKKNVSECCDYFALWKLYELYSEKKKKGNTNMCHTDNNTWLLAAKRLCISFCAHFRICSIRHSHLSFSSWVRGYFSIWLHRLSGEKKAEIIKLITLSQFQSHITSHTREMQTKFTSKQIIQNKTKKINQ